MASRKQKKNVRQRAGTTHGWGSMKKHRGAGSRGGRGMAGTGKRGDQKKTLLNPRKYFGKKGFHSVKSVKTNSINLADLERRLPLLIEKKLAEEKSGLISVDLNKINVQKLLSLGNLTSKLSIKVNKASKRAIEKVEKAGGKVELLEQEEFVAAEETEE